MNNVRDFFASSHVSKQLKLNVLYRAIISLGRARVDEDGAKKSPIGILKNEASSAIRNGAAPCVQSAGVWLTKCRKKQDFDYPADAFFQCMNMRPFSSDNPKLWTQSGPRIDPRWTLPKSKWTQNAFCLKLEWAKSEFTMDKKKT